MRPAIKKLFDWTPKDIAYWEKIRQKGLGRFITGYGLVITGGVLFVVFGLVTLFSWLRATLGTPVTTYSVIFLVGRLVFIALVCLVAGVVNSLITWVVEEKLYHKYKNRIITQPSPLSLPFHGREGENEVEKKT